MRWGVRKRDSDSVPDGTTTIVKVKPGKGVVGVRGGKNLPASDDAVKAAAYKQKAKASSVDALTNQELQAMVARMNLEQQYSKLTAKPSKLDAGQKKVKTILSVGSTINDVMTFANSPAGKAMKTKFSSGSTTIKAVKKASKTVKP
jgi:hypothetical protein